MAPVRIAYKIVVDPTTFEFIVMENQVFENSDGGRWLEKRVVEDEELQTWTREQFLERMAECGYEGAAAAYLKHHPLTFSCGQ